MKPLRTKIYLLTTLKRIKRFKIFTKKVEEMKRSPKISFQMKLEGMNFSMRTYLT